MMKQRITVFALLLCTVVQRVAAVEPAGAPIAITNVTVIDTTGGPAKPNMTVVIEGDRIARVESAGRARVSEGARIVDGTGKFLIPGLWDMHIHTFFGDWVPGGREVTLPLFIANGITGVRDMGSDLDPILAALHDVALGTLLGPRMVVSGPVPGFSLHQELQQFVDSGFTNMEALQTATLNPAKFLDKLNDFGTVEKGKVADLVLLDANPLDDIRNTRRIAAVISNGRCYSREQLDRILADVETYSRTH